MLAGVKFCGGCNPRYDRRKALETLKEYFQSRIDFEYAAEGKEYDFIVYLAGCTNRCTVLSKYVSKSDIAAMWSGEQLSEVIEQIEALLSRSAS